MLRGGQVLLRIITGTEHSGKTELLASMAHESVRQGKTTYIIIPDQFSLVYDRKIYGIMGAKDFNNMTVIGPQKLSRRLIERYGSSGRYCDDNTRLIMMYKACREFEASGDARYYKRSLGKGSFFKSVCETIDELRQSAADCKTLSAASESLTGTVADKLYDISRIYSLYLEQLDSYGLKDNSSAMEETEQIIKNIGYFNGCDVYFDSFSSFTRSQLGFLEAIFSQADNVTAALTIGSGRNASSPLSPFSECIKTMKLFEQTAANTGHKVERYNTDTCDYVSNDVKIAADNIFASAPAPTASDGGVKIVTAPDVYSEAEYVFAEIYRLVRDEGVSFGEIAIISRELDNASGILEDMAHRYGVPLFCDLRSSAAQSSPVLFIKAVADCITSKSFRTDAILRYIRSPLSDVTVEEASLIEDYAFKWSVDGDMWLSDFTASDKRTQSAKEQELSEVNAVRAKITDPLSKLKSDCQNATAKTVTNALNDFLQSVCVSERLSAELEESDNIYDEVIELSRSFRQVWELFVSAADTIYDVLGDEEITAKKYFELLLTMLSQLTVSTPPQRLYSVTAASAEHSRLSGIKAAFIIGVNDGHFPKNIKLSGLFSDREKELMKSADIFMEKRLETNIKAERFSCYQAVSCPSDRLYICVPLADKAGEHLDPSPIAGQIRSMFSGNISVDASKLPADFYCATRGAAVYKYSELSGKDYAAASAIRAALMPFPEEYGRIELIDSLRSGKEHSLDEAISKKLFFGENTGISATKTNNYYSCPFSYFCKYGMGVSARRKVAANSSDIGTIVHKCLEDILQLPQGGYNTGFPDMSDDEIMNAVSECVDEYIKDVMGGDFGKKPSFAADVARLKKQAFETVRNVRDELAGTDFVPTAFEFSLTDDSGHSIKRIPMADGTTAQLTGKIDRVDILEHNGECYVRVVDYKTGKKSFNYPDVYHGLDLQMLIYLLAVTTTANSVSNGRKLKPAGVIYMHAGEVELKNHITKKKLYECIVNESADEAALDKKVSGKKKAASLKGTVDSKRKTAFSRNGVILNDIDIALLMDKNSLGTSPVAVIKPKNKNDPLRFYARREKYALSEDAMNGLLNYADGKIQEMLSSLSDGNIIAMPTESSYYPCKNCDYKSVCGYADRADRIKVSEQEESLLLEKIGAKVSEQDAQEDQEEQ